MSQRLSELLTPEQKFQRKLFVVRIAMTQGTQQAVLRSGVPARTVRRWKARFICLGIEGLNDRSRAPKNIPHRKDTSGKLAQALCKL
jgi:hypothetical protein